MAHKRCDGAGHICDTAHAVYMQAKRCKLRISAPLRHAGQMCCKKKPSSAKEQRSFTYKEEQRRNNEAIPGLEEEKKSKAATDKQPMRATRCNLSVHFWKHSEQTTPDYVRQNAAALQFYMGQKGMLEGFEDQKKVSH